MHPLPLYLLTNVLGVLFIFFGNIKLTPQFFPEYYEQCRQQFGILNKEFPFYHQTEYRPLAKNYRTTVGAIETGAGTLLILGYPFLQSMSTIVLLAVMGNYLYAFYQLNYGTIWIGATIGIICLLLFRILLVMSPSHREKVPKSNAQQHVKDN